MNVIKRFDDIDLLKAIGIILMIMGHIGFGSLFDHYIHAFHMPMFFLISGYLYKTHALPLHMFVKKKVKSLLVPYICFAFLHYILYIGGTCMKNIGGGSVNLIY